MLKNEQIIETLDRWNFWHKDRDIGIIRDSYLQRLKLFLKTDEVIAVSGVRRVGKSTILLQLFDYLISKKKIPRINTLYINFEDEVLYPHLSIELLTQIYEAYKQIINPRGKIYIVFDEIQNIEGWEHFIRSLYDRKENVKLFVTGSSSALLSSEFSSLLTGRQLTMEIYPLNFQEYLKFKNMHIKTKLDEIHNKDKIVQLSKKFLNEGGFPKVILTKDELIRKELLTSYFNDIIVRDIVARYKIRDVSKIKNLALYYATNFCESFSFNSVKKALSENSLETIEKYSSYLESSYLVFFNKIFAYSLKKQMANEKKVYFIDNGMRLAVAFKFKDMFGNLLENAVHLELKKQGKNIFYHKDKKEVDFVIQSGLKIAQLINCCWDLSDTKTEEREVTSLKHAMDEYKLDTAYLVTFDQEKLIRIDNKKIKVIPFYKFCLGF